MMSQSRGLLAGACVMGALVALGVTAAAQTVNTQGPLPSATPPRMKVVAPTLQRPAPAEGAFIKAVSSTSITGSAALPVAQLPLPPGSYQIIAKGVLVNDSQVDKAVACALHTGKWDVDASDGMDYSSLTLAPTTRVPLTLVGSFANTTLADVPVVVSCRASEGAMASIRWVKLSAVAVPSVKSF